MRGDTGYAYLPAGQAEMEFAKYEQRIKALEAEIDKMRPVVEAAVNAVDRNHTVPLSLIDAVYDYKIAKRNATSKV